MRSAVGMSVAIVISMHTHQPYRLSTEELPDFDVHFATLREAQIHVGRYPVYQAGGYSIHHEQPDGRIVRVEHCEPRHSDARARQGLGQGDY